MLNLKNIITTNNNATGKTARLIDMKNILDEKMLGSMRLLTLKNDVNRQSDYHYLNLAVNSSTEPINGIDYIHPIVKPMVDYATSVISKGLAPNGEFNFEFVQDNELDSDGARQATNMVSKVVNQYNDPHSILQHWIMDSLLHKNGLMLISPSLEKTTRYVKISGKNDELRAFEAQAADAGLDSLRTSKRKVAVDFNSVSAEVQQYQYSSPIADFKQQMEIIANKDLGVDMDEVDYAEVAVNNNTDQRDEFLSDAIARHTIYEAEFKLTGNNVNIRFKPIAQHYWVCDPTVVNIQDQPFCGFYDVMSIQEVKDQYPDIDLNKFTQCYEQRSSKEIAEYHLAIHSRDSIPSHGVQISTPFNDKSNDVNFAMITTVWNRYDIDNDGELELVELIYSGDYIISAREVEFIPVANMCPRPLPQNFFGMSLAESLVPAQEYTTSAHRAEISLGLLTATPRIGVKPDKIDFEGFMDGESSAFMLDKNFDPSTDIYPIPAPSGNLGFLDVALSRLEKDVMGLVGMTTPQDVFNPEVMSAGNSGAKLSLAMGPNQLIQDNQIKNASSGLKEALWLVWRTLIQYSDEASVKKLAQAYHPDGLPRFIDADEFDNFNFGERKLIQLELATGMRSEENAIQRLQIISAAQEKLYATVQNLLQSNSLTPEVYKKVKKPIEDILYTLGVKDCNTYLPTDQEVMMMIEQATLQAQNRQPTPDEQLVMARVAVETARAQEITGNLPIKQQEAMIKAAKSGYEAQKLQAQIEDQKVNTRLNLADAIGNTAERKLEIAAQMAGKGTNY